MVCCLLAICGSFAIAGEKSTGSALSYTVDNAYVSKYMWRGIALNKDGAYQPAVTVSHNSGVSLNVWGSSDTTNVTDNRGHLTEVDYTLNYKWDTKLCGMNAGYVYYAFPNTSTFSTSEIYASACLSNAKFSPTLAAFYDVDESKGFYLNASTGYCCQLPGNKTALSTVDFAAKLGYGDGKHNELNYGARQAGFTDILLSASLPWKVSEGWKVTPSLSYTRVINDDLRDSLAARDVKNDNFFGSVTATYEF